MTEADWLASDDPQAMLDALRGHGLRAPDGLILLALPSDRKLRLFVEAVECRECESHFRDDGWAWRAAYVAGASCSTRDAKAALLREVVGDPFRAATLPTVTVRVEVDVWDGGPAGYRDEQRCPWLTPQVLSLAQAAYAIRCRGCEKCYDGWLAAECIRPCQNVTDGTLDPFRLALVADALEEAGCCDEALLRHLRSPGPHVRGCWALDLVLGGG